MDKNLSELTNKNAMLIGLALCIVYFFVFYNNGVLLETNIVKMKNDIVTKKQEKNKIQEIIKNLDDYERLKNDLGEKLNETLAFMPNKLSHSNLNLILVNEAKAAGLNIKSVKPVAGSKDYVFYEELEMKVVLEGRFEQILKFLSFLTEVKQMMTIGDVSLRSKLSADGTAPMITFVSTISGYKYSSGNNKKKKK